MRIANDLLINAATVSASQSGAGFPVDHMVLADITASITGANVSNKTFDTGSFAALIVQDLTYTAKVPGVAGNSITIEYTDGATAGAEVVAVVGNAISVQIQTTVSTADQVKAAVDASAPAMVLVGVAVTGTGATAQVTAAAAALTAGSATEVSLTPNTVSVPAHGYTTGTLVTLTTTGTLPAGLATATPYFLYVPDANTVGFATSQANAAAGTLVDITGYGSDDGVHTIVATATLTGTFVLQKNNEPADLTPIWKDIAAATVISAAVVLNFPLVDMGYREIRAVVTMTSGTVLVSARINAKGG